MTSTDRIKFACQTYAWQMSGAVYRGRLEHMAAVAAGAGFAGLEPEVVMLGQLHDPARIAESLRGHGLELAALAYAERWREPRETEAERAEADRVIELVRHFPGSKLVLVQLPGADRSDLAARQRHALSCINAVGGRARAAGATPTVHPNSPPGSVFRTAEDYERLIDGLHPAIGFTPDVGHIAAGGMDPIDVLRRYRDWIDHVHFKDIDENGVWAPTGGGVIDFAAIVEYLRDTVYRGWMVFEDECWASEADPDTATERNGAYARDTLASLLTQQQPQV